MIAGELRRLRKCEKNMKQKSQLIKRRVEDQFKDEEDGEEEGNPHMLQKIVEILKFMSFGMGLFYNNFLILGSFPRIYNSKFFISV